ncbi:MAG TPA: DUF6457 domain-containing protein [Gaiellaceae bacterium]|nr:DUF6457 domain-containing protein [Gaiellaceae bacterium]
MDAWLEEARARVAGATGEEASRYDLAQAEVDALLDLARIAAHASGERVNAPLLCYLVGLAHGRNGGKLEDLVDAAIGTSA